MFILQVFIFTNINAIPSNSIHNTLSKIIDTSSWKDTVPTYKKNYYISLEKWQKEKLKHNNSYEYTILNQPLEGNYYYYFLTTVVKNGVIVKRKYYELRKKEQIEAYERDKRVHIRWKENKHKIGSHDYYPARTFDDLYAYCEKNILADSKDYKITFSAEHNGLLSYFSKVHTLSVCGFGYLEIYAFKWLD